MRLKTLLMLSVALCVASGMIVAAEEEAATSAVCQHEAPKDLCFICDASLREKGRLWCKEHNRYEDRCWECHPDQRDAKRAYCDEHGLYEDECFLCDPQRRPGAEAQPAATSAATAKCPHAASKALCFICDPKLREKGRLWCKEHDRYEDRCWACHSDLRDPARAYCEEHGLYEDECFLCDPKLSPNTGKTSAATPVLMCKEHRVPEMECGICHPELADQIKTGEGLKVRFASPEAASKAGIETALSQVGPRTDGVECYAELTFNQNKLAQISVPVGGIVQSVNTDLGSKVMEGDVLATIWSATIGEATAKAVLNQQNVLRERKLHAERISSEKDLQEAESAFSTTHQQLKALGFDAQQIEALATQSVESAMLEIRAPFSGEIVERNAIRGAFVEEGRALFTLADRSTMWAMLNIPEKQLPGVELGQSVELHFDALPGRSFTGTLTWIATQIDDRTRMARARTEVANPDGLLLAQMFASARIITSSSENAVVVPQSSIQCINNRNFVFVALADDLFEARFVKLGGKLDDSVEISEGLRGEERIVISSAFVAKSQLLLSRLGAGCVDD